MSFSARAGLYCRFLSSPADCHAPKIRLAWDQMLSGSDPIGAVYRSPAWYDHMNTGDPKPPCYLAVLLDQADEIRGIAALGIRRVPVPVTAAGRTLLTPHLRVVDIFGGQPLLAGDAESYDCLFSALAEQFPDCDGVRLAEIPVGGALSRYLDNSSVIRQRFLLCDSRGLAPYQALPLPKTYAQYLAHFARKRRYNLRRQERLLRQHGSGTLELKRWESPDDVGGLLRQLALLSDRAGPADVCGHRDARHPYAEVACRGLLRCYTLYMWRRSCGCPDGLPIR